jgi:hypothetical protein
LCSSKQGIIPRLDSKYVVQSNVLTRRRIEHMGRAAAGLCLLHDVGAVSRWNPQAWVYRQITDLLHNAVDFFGAAEFLPYWDNADVIETDAEGIYVSAYRNGDKAVLVVVNANDNDVPMPKFTLHPELLSGKRVQSVVDPEIGTSDWRCVHHKWTNMHRVLLDRHGLMLLLVR